MLNYFYKLISYHFLFLLFFIPQLIISGQTLVGAKQSALSNSAVAQSNDAFGIYGNPAGIAQMHWREFGIYYSPSPFGLKELANANAVYVEPTSFGNLGIGFSLYGFELFKENKLALTYANEFWNNYFIGVTLIYQNLKIKNYGSANAFNLILGGISYITNDLRIGFSIENLLRSTYGEEKNQIPVIIQSGFSYDVLDNAVVNIAVFKELGYNFSVRFGAEYLPVEFLALRFGMNTFPGKYSAGVGINFSFFQIDYAVEHHNILGITHQFGLTLQFSGFENRIKAVKHYLFEQK